MQDIILLSQPNGEKNIYDIYQDIINCYIKSNFFPWVCLILILNRNNLKRPVILILIAHWFFRSTGDLLRNTMHLRPKSEIDWYWPYNRENWYISNGIAHIFWLSGEIIGDWYPLLRTKAVTNNSRKMRIVYVTCIIYNFVKVFGMYCFFMNNPIDLSQKSIPDGHGRYKTVSSSHLSTFNVAWWSTITVMQIASILYDISVISSLRKCLFNKINTYQSNSKKTFMDKFKQISELRIVVSTIASMVFLPFVITFVIYVLLDKCGKLKTNITFKDEDAIEQIRQMVLSINYNLMYIDQILLRRYANPNKTYKKSNNSNSDSNHSNYKRMNMNDIEKSYILSHDTNEANDNLFSETVLLNSNPSNSSNSNFSNLINNSNENFIPIHNIHNKNNNYYSNENYSNHQLYYYDKGYIGSNYYLNNLK